MSENRILRHLHIFLLLLFCIGSLHAQLYVGLGLQAGFNKMNNADRPVDRFNDTGFLFKQMRHFRWPAGEIYDLSIRPGRWIFDLNLNTHRQRVSAESFDANTLIRRDIRFVLQSLSLGAGYDLAKSEGLAVYLGLTADFGYMRLLTRFGPKESLGRSNYYLIARQPMMASTLFARIVFHHDPKALSLWSLTPYLQFPLHRFDFRRMNQELNPATFHLDGNLPARPINFGLAFNVDIELLNFLTD